LGDARFAVEQVRDGLMALRQIAMQVPDLTLTDVRMPHLDGIGLATSLAPHTPPIRTILMCATRLPAGDALIVLPSQAKQQCIARSVAAQLRGKGKHVRLAPDTT
jgi:CheY-like chemotaxis protein